MVDFPPWFGTAPAWGTFVVVSGAVLRWSLPWRKLSIDSATQIRNELKVRVDELKKEHRECQDALTKLRTETTDAIQKCRDDCDAQTDKLQQEIYGMQRQHIQEQLSLINAIMNSVGDNPQLKQLLLTFETVQASLKRVP